MSLQQASAVACHGEHQRLPRSYSLSMPPRGFDALSSSQLSENSADFQAITAFGRGAVAHKCCCCEFFRCWTVSRNSAYFQMHFRENMHPLREAVKTSEGASPVWGQECFIFSLLYFLGGLHLCFILLDLGEKLQPLRCSLINCS